MRRLTMVLALIAASGAFAQGEAGTENRPGNAPVVENHPGEEAAPKESLAETIVGHVADAHELEVDLPWGAHYAWQLPTIRIPLKAGACPANPDLEASFGAGCLDLSITRHVVMMWIAGLLLILTFLLGSHRKKDDLVPHGASANLLEILVLFVRNEIAIPNIGKKDGPRYVPYLLTIFFFILFMNLLGLVPYMATPTGNLSVTLGLAICTFVLTEIGGLRSAGLKTYLAHLTGGAPLWLAWMMIPIEILGKFTKPFALTVRLFANMIAGHIGVLSLFGLIFILKTAGAAAIAVPFALFFYFLDLFVAFVQAYVFCILSAVFIGMAVAMGHHDHAEGHGEAHGEAAHAHAAEH
jgi:F-type H+-transporting ATPase subunit a